MSEELNKAISKIQEMRIHLKPAYERAEIDNALRLALAVCSGRIPYIRRSEMLLIGLYEEEFSGYVEVDDRIREMCENYIYNEIMHYPHSY